MSLSDDERDAIDSGWRIHDAQIQWTSQVDAKASFTLAIETAIAAGVVALSGDGRRLSSMRSGWPEFYFAAGVGLLVVGLLAAAWTILPRIRSKATAKNDAADQYVFFGHAMSWEPDKLANRLRKHDTLDVLTYQIVVMADIAWRKHRALQVSLVATGGGVLLVALSAMTNGA